MTLNETGSRSYADPDALPCSNISKGDNQQVGDKQLQSIPDQKSVVTPSEKVPAKQGNLAVNSIVLPRENCGTFWTGWVKDIKTANPCPKGCERGEHLQLNEHKNDKERVYQANYQCYRPKLEIRKPPVAVRPAGAAPRRNCGTMWTGWHDDPYAVANPCPANCVRGELRLVNRSRSGDKLQYDMNYQCYVKEPVAKQGTLLTTPSKNDTVNQR